MASMACTNRVSPLRIDKPALQRVSITDDCSSVSSLEEDCGSAESEDMSTSPDTSCRSRADADKSFDLQQDFREKLDKFGDIIEKIENLRLARDNDNDNDDNDDDGNEGKDTNENVRGVVRRVSSAEKVDNVEYRNICKSLQTGHRAVSEDINNNEKDATTDENEAFLPLNIDDKPCGEERRESFSERDSADDEISKIGPMQRHRDSDDSDLIERGPIKPDSQPLRGHPYSMVSWFAGSRMNEAGANVAHVDYDKTAEQILRNKDFSEKLNPCLDQLSNSSRNQSSIGVIVGSLALKTEWSAENDIYRNDDPANDSAGLPSIIVDNADEESLMNILSRGGFQAAVLSDTGSHSIPSPSAKTWSDSPASSYNCNVVSRSNSRASSRAQSPGSATNLESPQIHVNVIGSPLGSPQITSTYRISQALSSSSSSSNQSYGDASSPLNYQTSLSYQIEEQFGESLSDWKGIYDSSGTIVNSTDTIDCALLQLVEQVIEEDKQRKALKESQLASSVPCVSLIYSNRCASVLTLENNLSHESHEPLANNMQDDKPETCLSMPTNTSSDLVNNLPIDSGRLVSVYTSKENTGGCTFVSRTINGDAASLEQRYYESPLRVTIMNNAEVNVTQHDGLHGEGSVKTSEQSLRTSQEKYAMFHPSCVEKKYNQPSSQAFVANDYQSPPMVSSFLFNHLQRDSSRGIAPWPSLNLPSVRASERLKEGLHPKEVERAMSNLLKKSVEELAAADEDGDTALMCLVGNPEELTKKKAYLVPLVERLGNMPGALSMVNNQGKDALYLAAMNCPEMPYVTGYLAAAMLQKGIDIDQKLYHIRGDTLIHSVVARGDSHGEILAELLALKTLQGNPIFDLSKCNYDGRTALHIAVESHDPVMRGIKSLATTRLLLENGADLEVKESKCGHTALHMAASLSCDPALLKVLLCKATTNVNETNYMYNTPLHMAAAVSTTVSLGRQKEVCWLLMQAGAQTNIQNRQGKTPLALVSPDRKEVIRRMFYKKS